jgi:acetyl esterase/lipase
MKKTVLFLFFCGFAQAQQFKDIVYAKAPNRDLKLDIYLPIKIERPIPVFWIHGGAWSGGTKENPPKQLLDHGFALISVDFRLSTEAAYPAMVHDIKAAIRFIDAQATQYGLNKSKKVIWGSSSGGHLAALVGLSNGHKDLEGELGDFDQNSSKIDLIIDFYGPSNFRTILNQSTPHGLSVRKPAMEKYFGVSNLDNLSLYDQASPVFQVEAHDPPVFIAHGNQDIQVPINQSLELYAKLQEKGVKTQLEVLQETAHGGGGFNQKGVYEKLVEFISKNLGK